MRGSSSIHVPVGTWFSQGHRVEGLCKVCSWLVSVSRKVSFVLHGVRWTWCEASLIHACCRKLHPLVHWIPVVVVLPVRRRHVPSVVVVSLIVVVVAPTATRSTAVPTVVVSVLRSLVLVLLCLICRDKSSRRGRRIGVSSRRLMWFL